MGAGHGRKAGRENCRRVCPLPERQKVSCLIYGALNEKAPKVHFKLRFDSSGVQLRAAVPLPALTSSTCSCSLSLSLCVWSNAVKMATRHGVNMANGLFRISLHLVTPRNGYVRCDRIRFDAMSARSVSHSSSVLFFFKIWRGFGWAALAVLFDQSA